MITSPAEAQANATAEADAQLSNAGLKTYTQMVARVIELETAMRRINSINGSTGGSRGLWIVYAVDAEGNQLWDAQYFANRARLEEAFK